MKILVRVAVCFWAAKAFALDPQRAIAQLVHTSWTEQQGAPDDIRALAQTADGYLWLGTTTGLFHFDGARFRRFEPRPGEQFPALRIRTLLAARDGSLWVIFNSGIVSRFRDGHLTTYSDRNGLPATFAMTEDVDGSVLAGTAGSVMRFRNGVWHDARKEWDLPPGAVTQLFFDKQQTLWILSGQRILYLPHGTAQVVEVPEKNGASGNFAQASDGTVWISETGRSAHVVGTGARTEVRVGATGLLFDKDGSLWIATSGDGLRRVADPGRIAGHSVGQFGTEAEQFTSADGLLSNYVSAVLEDREGNIWCGSLHGLDRFRDSAFAPVAIPHPDVPRAILASRDGSILTFSLNPVGNLRLSASRMERVMGLNAFAMHEDEKGDVWMLQNDRLYRTEHAKLIHVQLPGDAKLSAPTAITTDRQGAVWILDRQDGLLRFAQGKLTNLAGPSSPVYHWGYLFTDRLDRVWVGQYDRVTMYENGAATEFGPREGIPPSGIFTIYEDRAGDIWVGGDGGLSRFEKGRFRLISKAAGFPTRSVFGLTEDAGGAWWIADEAGVARIPREEMQRLIAAPSYRVRYETFNVLDGLPAKPRRVFPMPVVVRAADGRIWVATTDGIAVLDPHRITRNKLPPPVHVESVIADGKEVAPAEGLEFRPGTNDLEIDYTALSLTIPERVHFRYKLEGADAAWRDAGTRRQAFYSRLPPKPYRFRVIASNNDGVWNETGAAWTFTIAPVFYQRLWFQLVCLAAGTSFLWFIYQRRVRQVTAQVNLSYNERLAERTRIARDLHDTLLQNLAGISLQLDGVSKQIASAPDRAAVLILNVRQQVDACFREARIRVWNLRTPLLAEQGLASAIREFLSRAEPSAAARCELTVSGIPSSCSPRQEEELLHIAQEAINNAIRHARPSSIRVVLEYSKHSLILRITDDGIGFDPLAVTGSGHWGLRNIRERAAEIRAACEIKSVPGKGTQIEVSLPLGRTFRSHRVTKVDPNSDRG